MKQEKSSTAAPPLSWRVWRTGAAHLTITEAHPWYHPQSMKMAHQGAGWYEQSYEPYCSLCREEHIMPVNPAEAAAMALSHAMILQGIHSPSQEAKERAFLDAQAAYAQASDTERDAWMACVEAQSVWRKTILQRAKTELVFLAAYEAVRQPFSTEEKG